MTTLFSEGEVASALGVSIRKLQQMRKSGKGPTFVKIGRQVRYESAALDAFLKACMRGAMLTGDKSDMVVK